MKIESKITLGFMVIYILTIIIAGVFLFEIRKEIKSYIGSGLVTLATETADKIDREIYNLIDSLKTSVQTSSNMIRALEQLSSKAADYDKERKAVSLELNRLSGYFEKSRRRDVFKEVIITDRNGMPVAQTREPSASHYRDEEWWLKAKEAGFFVGDAQYDWNAKMHYVTIAVALKDEKDAFLGILKTTLNLEEVYSIIEGVQSEMRYQKSYIELVDSEGYGWYRTNPSHKFEKIIAPGSTVDIVSAGKSGFIVEKEIDRGEVFLRAFGYSRGFGNYKGLGWTVIINVSANEVFAPVSELTGNIIMVLAVSSFFIFFIGRLIALTISRPIARLHRGMENISSGDLDYRVGMSHYKDEVGELSVAFDNMISSLKETRVSRDELAREVSERRKVEEELKVAYNKLREAQSQLLQAAKMASIGMLAGGVAHEINNPLTGILNNVQLVKMMRERNKPLGPAEFKEILEAVEESALRCKKITQSLLSFSRVSKGDFKPVSLSDIADKVLELIGHEIKLNNISIKRDFKPGVPQVRGDPQLLQQVVFDIMANAEWAISKKKDRQGGMIYIETGYEKDKDRVVLSISDTGIGIPEENLDKVFAPFFTTKVVGEGTGLGLSIAYNIIKGHNGAIEVESREDRGATFRISLPSAEEGSKT